ncbi:DMT family transporter [Aureivirga sp. CE67]|uniref:DMT family transporter n=1 Tax=Aureivirga sp. CE67 TaxID=1788983 RepID=UPI0018CBD127|nr:DMT family transporter [Aureivirga sp. CE67]
MKSKSDTSTIKTTLGYLFGILSTLFWAGNFIVAKEVQEVINPLVLNYSRWLVAFVAITPFSFHLFTKKNFNLIKSDFKTLLIISITGVSILNSLIYLASQSTSAINLSLIETFYPIFLIILSIIFLKYKIKFVGFVGVIITIIGIAILISNGSIENIIKLKFKIGDIYMLLASFSFAIYTIFLKRKNPEITNHLVIYVTIVIGLLVMTPFYFLVDSEERNLVFDEKYLYYILYIGIAASLLGYYLWVKAIEFIGIIKTSLLYYLIPVFSSLLANIILHEKITLIDLVSMVLIISGVYISTRNKMINENKE